MVTLGDLKTTKVRATVGSSELTFRALSHFELQERDEAATYAMVQRRRDIEKPGTRANTIYYGGLETSSVEELQSNIFINAVRQYYRDSVRTIRAKIYPLPDNATDEEKSDVLQKREDEPARVRAEQNEYVKKASDELTERNKSLSREEILRMAKNLQLGEQINVAWVQAFQDYTLYACVYEDWECTKRVFESPEAVAQMPGEPDMGKKQLRDELLAVYFEKVDRVRESDLINFFSTVGSTESVPPSKPEDSAPKTSESVKSRKSRGGGRP